jgi:hypothetical protein
MSKYTNQGVSDRVMLNSRSGKNMFKSVVDSV